MTKEKRKAMYGCTSGTVSTGPTGNGPDAYVERVLRDIDDRGNSHVARINRETGQIQGKL